MLIMVWLSTSNGSKSTCGWNEGTTGNLREESQGWLFWVTNLSEFFLEEGPWREANGRCWLSHFFWTLIIGPVLNTESWARSCSPAFVNTVVNLIGRRSLMTLRNIVWLEVNFSSITVILLIFSWPNVDYEFQMLELLVHYLFTGDKSGAESPGPSEFRISFKWFSKVFILEFFKRIWWFFEAAGL